MTPQQILALLSLVADLYAQLQAAQAENAELRQRLAEAAAPGEDEPPA